jgi:hypothetical protein
MDWKETDQRLIRRGELILDPTTLKNHAKELKTMNRHRIGRPYTLSNSIIKLLTAIRYLYGLPYRQLEGFQFRGSSTGARVYRSLPTSRGKLLMNGRLGNLYIRLLLNILNSNLESLSKTGN